MYSRICISTIVILLVFFGLWSRLFLYPSYPFLHVDEMAFGYSAYSFLSTGLDEYGRPPALVLESLGDWKFALYAYFVMPFVAFLGLNAWAVRLPSLIFSIFTMIGFFLLSRQVLDKKFAAQSTLFLWFLPWHLVFSRTAHEVVMGTCFLLWGLYYLLRYFHSHSKKDFGLSFVLGALSIASYYPFLIATPALFFLSLLFQPKRVPRAAILPALVLLTSVLIYTSIPHHRIESSSQFEGHAVKALLHERISISGQSGLGVTATRLLHNKYLVNGYHIVSQFLDHASLKFAFLPQAASPTRYTLPFIGMVPILAMPLFFLGVWIAIRQLQPNKSLFLLGWFIVAIIPGAMTVDRPHLYRVFILIPVLVWLIVFGLRAVLATRFKTAFLGILLLGLIAESVLFYLNYFSFQRFYKPHDRDGHVHELVNEVEKYQQDFSKVYIADIPYLQMMFESQLDPVEAQKILAQDKINAVGLQTVPSYNDYLNMPVSCPMNGRADILFVCRGSVVPANSQVLSVVRFQDSTPAFVLLHFQELPNPELEDIDRLQIMPQSKSNAASISLDANLDYR
jgi:4-amino-4-deoxy-L-arabinose transferase-like glycosyltransferase